MNDRARSTGGPLLALVIGMVGCTHNHYYYTTGTPVAVEMTDSPGTAIDPCDPLTGRRVSTRGGGSTAVARGSSPAVVRESSPVVVRRSSPMRSRRVPSADSPSRVVISQPSGGAALAGRDRGGWAPGRYDPEPRLSTRAAGGDETTRIR